MKHNLLSFKEEGFEGIVTFGGAFSNHIYASAAIGKELGIPMIGVIRGEWEEIKDNPTIRFAQDQGMKLIPVTRMQYRNKKACVNKLNLDGKYYVLPEGGTNKLAIKGCAEVIDEVKSQMAKVPDFVISSAGSGGTAAGLLKGMQADEAFSASKLLVFPALKGQWMKNEILELLGQSKSEQLVVNNSFHCGGYGKWTEELVEFIQEFNTKHDIPLDPIYNGKTFMGTMALIEKGFFPKGSQILLLHTGGLQGIAGFEEKTGNKLM